MPANGILKYTFLELWIWQFIQIVFSGDDFKEISGLVFRRKKEIYFFWILKEQKVVINFAKWKQLSP